MKHIPIDRKKVIFIFVIVLFVSFCSFKTEPEKVWNLRSKIVVLSKSLIGFPYKYGGYDLEGFDCSGFVYYVYDCFGIKLPRTAKKQGKLKGKVKLSRAKLGDIIIFKIRRGWHSGILIGKDYFIHAPSRGGAVRREHLSSYWLSRLKRVISIIDDF